jgi:hypothetical protein
VESSLHLVTPSSRLDDLTESWEDYSSSEVTLPPITLGTSVPSTHERPSRHGVRLDRLQNFNFSRQSALPNQFPSARLTSSTSFSPSGPSGTGCSEHNPLLRWRSDQGPWNPISNDTTPPAKRTDSSQLARANFNFHTYRSAPQSELESTDTGFFRSDSGYHTHSVRSAEPADCSQELPVEFTEQFNSSIIPFSFTMSSSLPTPNSDHPEPHHVSRSPSPAARGKGHLETCKICNETPKCPSDFRYAHRRLFDREPR